MERTIDLKLPCPKCGSLSKKYTLKLTPTGRSDRFFPKWNLHLKELCFECEEYIRFAPQTEELIEKLNQKLLELEVVDV